MFWFKIVSYQFISPTYGWSFYFSLNHLITIYLKYSLVASNIGIIREK